MGQVESHAPDIGPENYEELWFGYDQPLFAPRVFRSWSRHLPMILTKNGELLEWTTKNESGDGLVNNTAARMILGVQKEVLKSMVSNS